MPASTARKTSPDKDDTKASSAIDLLKADHREVEGLFAQARKAGLEIAALGDEMAARKDELMS